MLVKRKHIRERAVDILERFGVRKAPVPVEKLAERLGAKVIAESAPDDLSGFLVRDPHKNLVIIGVNADHHENRRRFTIGHELGHFLLHKGEHFHVDKRGGGYYLNMRDGKSGTRTNIDEMEANLFAAELLMPASFLKDDLKKHSAESISDEERIQTLAEKYKVSEQALTLRLTYLGYIEQ